MHAASALSTVQAPTLQQCIAHQQQLDPFDCHHSPLNLKATLYPVLLQVNNESAVVLPSARACRFALPFPRRSENRLVSIAAVSGQISCMSRCSCSHFAPHAWQPCEFRRFQVDVQYRGLAGRIPAYFEPAQPRRL